MKKEITRIIMRSKAEYVVSKEQGDVIRDRIGNATGSVFLNIKDLGVSINSADISEIIDDLETVAQDTNLLAEGKWTPEDRKKREEIIRNTRVQLEARGVL